MEWAEGGGYEWIREASVREGAFEAALKGRVGFQEVEPAAIGGRPAKYWGEAGRANGGQVVKGTGRRAEEFT